VARPKKDRLLPISLHKDGGNENAGVEPYLTLEERYLTSTCLAQCFHEAVSRKKLSQRAAETTLVLVDQHDIVCDVGIQDHT